MGDLEKLNKKIKDHKFEVITSVPADEMVSEYDLEGKPVFSLPADSKALSSLFDILDSLVIPWSISVLTYLFYLFPN